MTVPRTVLTAVSQALRESADGGALAVVVDTEGSTYAHAGAMALFGGPHGQVGWLSGGCLEPDIDQRAQLAARDGVLDWMDIDTRDDEDLLSGSAVGCRGRLHLALWPLARMAGIGEVIEAWQHQRLPLQLGFSVEGLITANVGEQQLRWQLPMRGQPPHRDGYRLTLAPPPRVLVFGGGPESPLLLPLLRQLGWQVILIERRPRWRDQAQWADEAWPLTPTEAAEQLHAGDAVLVMHHHFELDREALAALAERSVDYVGLLGPSRRRDDLFRVLPASARERLRGCLRSPVGLPLGGQGAEAIALSIAAQLQAHRHGVMA
ncbi:MAG TPA: XdhC family protein [Pseudoxanthomonas sp.]|nr:XdhC family protein [Pseudoxanthomonas sp.]